MKIDHWNSAVDGELSEEKLRQKLSGLGYQISREVYQPGTRFPEHAHPSNKIDAVLSGRLRLTMGGESVVLQAGDWAYVPQGVNHSAEVEGDEAVVSLDGVKVDTCCAGI